MSNTTLIEKLEAAMRFVYAHFMDADEGMDTFMLTRKPPTANIRHVTRKMLLTRYACNYYDIVGAERQLCDQLKDNHSRISHSVHKPIEKYQSHDDGQRVIKNLLDQFEAYWMELQDPEMIGRLQFYYELPRHQLALMLYFIQFNGWVEDVRLDGLHQEFSAMNKKFVEDKIANNTD